MMRRPLTPRQRIGRIHLLRGFAFWLVVLILSLTVCFHVLEEQIKSLVNADRRFLEPLPMKLGKGAWTYFGYFVHLYRNPCGFPPIQY